MNRLTVAALASFALSTSAHAQTAKRAAEVRVSDFTSIIDSGMAMLPKAVGIMSFVLLAMLLWQSFKKWKSMSLTELAAVVIAFAIVAGGR